MKHPCTRRKFIRTGAAAALGSAALGPAAFGQKTWKLSPALGQHQTGMAASDYGDHVVTIVRIRDGNTGRAVEEAIDLLGGITEVTKGKERIILKPNLVTSDVSATTKPEVIKALAQLMKNAGKDVMIGEGSAAALGFNATEQGEVFRTRKQEILDGMQKKVFEDLGYQDLGASMGIPLINFHSGELVQVPLENGYMFDSITLHRSLTETDLLCSVPIMKTHTLATVTLAMKNLIGLYPGTEYYSARAWLHDRAAEKGSPGVAYEVVDMVRANKTGLSVIDASTAMEGDGPTGGGLVDLNLIIAGTSPLAADMVGATVMGFETDEIPAIVYAHEAGMGPFNLEDIEVRGLKIEDVRHSFVRPNVFKWTDIRDFWGATEI